MTLIRGSGIKLEVSVSHSVTNQPWADVLSLRQGCSSIKKSPPAAEKAGPPSVLGPSKAWMELQGRKLPHQVLPKV